MKGIKEGFKGERMLSLPQDILNKYSELPLVSPLYVRKIGFFPRVRHHYVQKPQGTDYCMLIYCVSGKGHYSIGGGEPHPVDENQYIILPSGMPYTFWADNDDPWTIYWVHFQGSLANHFVTYPIMTRSILPGNDSRLQARLDLFERIYSSFTMAYVEDFMVYASMCLYPFLSSFINLKAFRNMASSVNIKEEQTFSTLVIHYMQENIANNLSLNDFASNFNYSPSHFSALFQKETGYSPINYYIQLKMRRACQYIERSSMKLNEVAQKVGFSEPAYFSRIFTKIMGMSPSEYRQRESDNR